MAYRLENKEFTDNDIGLINGNRKETQDLDDAFLAVPGNRNHLNAFMKILLNYIKFPEDASLLPALKYPNQLDSYVEEYNKTCNSYSKHQNLIRIYMSVQSPLFDILKSANDSIEPEDLLNLLSAHLGKPNELATFIDQFENLPNFNNDVRDLPEHAKLFIDVIDSLKNLNNVGYLNNSIAKSIIMDKMTEDMVNYYPKYVNREYPEYVWCFYCRQEKIEKDNQEGFFIWDYDYIPHLIQLKNFFFYLIALCNRFSMVMNMKKDNVRKNMLCVKCGGDHEIEYCFGLHTLDDRLKSNVPSEYKICRYCLADERHTQKPCTKKHCQFEFCCAPHHVLLHEFMPVLNLALFDEDKTVWRTVKSEKTKSPFLQILEYCVIFQKSSITYSDTRKDWLLYRHKYNTFSHLYTAFQNIAKIFISLEGPAYEMMESFLCNGVCEPQDMMRMYYEVIGKPTLVELITEYLMDIPNVTEQHTTDKILEFNQKISSVFDRCISKELNINEHVMKLLLEKVQLQDFIDNWNVSKLKQEVNLKNIVCFINTYLLNYISGD